MTPADRRHGFECDMNGVEKEESISR